MFGNLFFLKPKLLKLKKKAVYCSHYNSHKETARVLISAQVSHLAGLCKVTPKRIAIRNTKRNWGSCSSLGNLNFNYKVALLPACLRDYIIIHELCHLVHLNHKPEYWAEVEKQCADYRHRIIAVREVERVTKMKASAITEFTKTHQCTYCTAKLVCAQD